MKKVSLIDITDLYHPYQDPGDNLDLVMPYALPEIDLKAVILDCTDKYRQPVAEHRIKEFTDTNGPREAGFIPVMQLNYIFNKNIPFAVGPFTPMETPEDKMLDVPKFQQQGIELILNVLRNSTQKVVITVFSSLRSLAAAFNREPQLFFEKVERIHISAGASSDEFLEWNVELDKNAFVCLLRSKLPICIYPCATNHGPFDLGEFNSFWKLENLLFIKNMDIKIKRYLWFALKRIKRVDFLRAMDENVDELEMEEVYKKDHNVWETAVWLGISARKLVCREDGTFRIIPEREVLSSDQVMVNELLPCKIIVNDEGLFSFKVTEEDTNFKIYYRDKPKENEKALREAFTELYQSFRL